MKNFFFLIAVLMLAGKAQAIDISAAGGLNRTIGSSDLVSGAGSALAGDYESPASASSIDVFNCADNSDNWRIDVSRSGGTWSGDFTLQVRRTSDGSGGGSVSGGISYIAVGTTAGQFFSGGGNRNGMNVQYKLSGVSLQIAPGTYATTVIYTVVDSL
jgi:hypothetical protein